MIRVLLADGDHRIRDALTALLALEEDLEVVATATSGSEAKSLACRDHPDVAVLDLRLPERDGINAAASIHEALPACKTVVVATHDLPGHLKRALEVGVNAFVPKSASAHELAQIIRRVHRGDRYIDPSLVADAVSSEGSVPGTD
ncbi:response regulator [Streptomyces halobius]|uniref:Response regulator n=1 Tax=Streptomyces halobius TaxID=2879846 RepID=A0ABY4MIK3_9ACTN|nr:response regulator [Streptomyces halobius]UQA97527.1 response regulator [Streptomyces halobius]